MLNEPNCGSVVTRWGQLHELAPEWRGRRVVSVLGTPRVHGGGTWERVRAACNALTLCQEAI
jgi:hypothetical protein